MFKLKDTVFYVRDSKIRTGIVMGVKYVEYARNDTSISDNTYFGMMREKLGQSTEEYFVYEVDNAKLVHLYESAVFATKELLVRNLIG